MENELQHLDPEISGVIQGAREQQGHKSFGEYSNILCSRAKGFYQKLSKLKRKVLSLNEKNISKTCA